LDSWVVRDVLVKTADPNAGLPRLNVIKALVCTAALQQSASYPPPGSNTLPVHYWSCAMGTPFGSASGQRVGW
ncbi:MAG TPA: hypothetical protein VN851_14920, partial [Thermoanaerobaculia bacterium]|nr:hypothetical protein [Thermoanaerobaculia bacterium]